jgi:hypothetical protein
MRAVSDQPLLTEVAQVAGAWVRGRAAGVHQVTTGDHSERADGRECARLRAPECVLASAVVHDLTLRSAWQVDVALEHVPRRAATVAAPAFLVALTQVDDAVARGALCLAVGTAGTAPERRPRVATAGAPLATWTVRDGALNVKVAGV